MAIRRIAGPPTAAEGRPAPDRSYAMPADDPATLARQFVEGDAQAVQRVVDLYQLDVTRLVQRMLGESATADVADLVQETFIRAIETRAQFQGAATLKTWLSRIAINQCRSHYRKQQRRNTLLRVWHAALPQRHAPAADAAMHTQESTNRVHTALDQLPPRDREALVLYYLEEMSTDDMAQTLAITPQAVTKRLSRARMRLRKLLDPNIIDDPTD